MEMNTGNRISVEDFFRLVAVATSIHAVDKNKMRSQAGRVKDKRNIPIVVIGSGLGGLSAGAYFAKHGFPVTVLERHERPGGYATSFEREKERFKFEVSLHVTSGTKGGPLKRIFDETGILEKVEMVDLPEQSRVVAPDYDIIFPYSDPKGTIDILCRKFPSEASGIKGFFKDIFGLLDESMIPFNSQSDAERNNLPTSHRLMWGMRNMTLSDLLDKHVQDIKVRSLLSHYWVYAGLPPSKLSAFRYALLCAGITRFGGQIVKGRSQDLSNALVESIEASGGRVLLDSEAVEIAIKDRAVSEVILKDGRSVKARVVVSNASPIQTVNMAKQRDRVKDRWKELDSYIDYLKTFRPSISTFGVWLGLKNQIRGKVNGYEYFILKTYDGDEDYHACLETNLERAGIGVAVYDNVYEGYSRPGTSTVVITMLNGYEYWRRFEKDYRAGRKKAYREEKDRIAEELIRQVEELIIPDLRSMIEVKVSSTPLTNWRYTHNEEGAIYGGEQRMDEGYIRRPDNRTPISGLYLSGAYTEPGSGYLGVLRSGELTFQKVIADLAGELDVQP